MRLPWQIPAGLSPVFSNIGVFLVGGITLTLDFYPWYLSWKLGQSSLGMLRSVLLRICADHSDRKVLLTLNTLRGPPIALRSSKELTESPGCHGCNPGHPPSYP